MTSCTLCHTTHDDDSPCAPAPVKRTTFGRGGGFAAKYDGRCIECNDRISVGDSIVMVGGVAIHDECQ